MSVISPELALVDPELAARARSLLPDPQPLPTVRAAQPSVGRGGRARSRRAGIVATTAVAAACAIVAAFLVSTGRDAGAVTGEKVTTPLTVMRARALDDARAAGTYAWSAVPGAVSYRVALLRGSRVVYAGTTPSASLELPTGLRLARGRYRWLVTPVRAPGATGPTRPVVEETFVVH